MGACDISEAKDDAQDASPVLSIGGWNALGHQRIWPFFSFIVHLVIFAWLILPALRPVPKERTKTVIIKTPDEQSFVHLVSPGGKPRHPNNATKMEPKLLDEQTDDKGVEQPNGGLTIKIRHDPDEQLRLALEKLGGHLGFGKLGDARYFQYLVQASDWRRIETDHTMFALEGYFVLELTPPGPWKFQEAVRARNGIPRGLAVYALFPLPFYDQVNSAIREELAAEKQPEKVEPKRIEIAFAPASPRGFRLRILATKVIDTDDHGSPRQQVTH